MKWFYIYYFNHFFLLVLSTWWVKLCAYKKLSKKKKGFIIQITYLWRVVAKIKHQYIHMFKNRKGLASVNFCHQLCWELSQILSSCTNSSYSWGLLLRILGHNLSHYLQATLFIKAVLWKGCSLYSREVNIGVILKL